MLLAAIALSAAFAGVTLGETEQQLVAQMGEPVLRTPADAGAIQYSYVGPGNTLEFVRVERGNVVSVAIKPSPWKDDLGGDPPSALGISLGDSPASFCSRQRALRERREERRRYDGAL